MVLATRFPCVSVAPFAHVSFPAALQRGRARGSAGTRADAYASGLSVDTIAALQ